MGARARAAGPKPVGPNHPFGAGLGFEQLDELVDHRRFDRLDPHDEGVGALRPGRGVVGDRSAPAANELPRRLDAAPHIDGPVRPESRPDHELEVLVAQDRRDEPPASGGEDELGRRRAPAVVRRVEVPGHIRLVGGPQPVERSRSRSRDRFGHRPRRDRFNPNPGGRGSARRGGSRRAWGAGFQASGRGGCPAECADPEVRSFPTE